jgi:hypothetical protein
MIDFKYYYLLLNSIQTVQVCDATKLNSSNKAGLIKKQQKNKTY